MTLGPHAAFIWGSYGAVALGLGGLLAWLIVDNRMQRAKLAQLEARGVRRRTATSNAPVVAADDQTPDRQAETP